MAKRKPATKSPPKPATKAKSNSQAGEQGEAQGGQIVSGAAAQGQTDNQQDGTQTGNQGDDNQDTDDNNNSTTQKSVDADRKDNEGQVIPAADGDGLPPVELPEGLPAAHAREGETRNQTWERLRREGRAYGMTRRGSVAYATRECDRLYPWQPPEPIAEEPTPEPIEEPEPIPVIPEPIPADVEADSPATDGLAGLSEIPGDWPDLPDNAALPAEVQWVQANRVRVRDGNRVDLSRSRSPAPSYASLSWLETAILFPAKWADIVARATSAQADEREHTRRERVAIEDVRGLLGEMQATT